MLPRTSLRTRRLRRSLTVVALALAVFGFRGSLHASPVGERHLTTVLASAALRDAEKRPQGRVTVWYPAARNAVEKRIDIGPPDRPLFRVGATAPDAEFQDARRLPVILLSHGFGGSARMMGWFGLAMAHHGYMVIAVDHPGNNGVDPMTVPGAILSWDRAQDLQAALDAVKADPGIGAHLDIERLGVAGFSAGGFTALISAGAPVDVQRLLDFCHSHPTDGVCAPQKELAISLDQTQAALSSAALAPEVAHAADRHGIAGIRAVFVMAPAIVQALPPQGLANLDLPVAIILGDADTVAPPQTNGLVAAQLIRHSELKVLPTVGHYDFLSTCTSAGIAVVPVCAVNAPQESTHAAALDMARAFFDHALRTR